MKKTLLTLCTILIAFGIYAVDPQYNIEQQSNPSDVKKPCLIIAPGNGYHKDLPIITDLAQQANEAGFITMRFNWTPRDPKLNDSEYNQIRYADILRMVDTMRAVSSADTSNIFISGKSLGSIYAYNVGMESRTCAV